MKTSKIVLTLLWAFIVAPIWYYLLYKILVSVEATELMMFLFWVYVPVAFICAVVSKITDDAENRVNK